MLAAAEALLHRLRSGIDFLIKLPAGQQTRVPLKTSASLCVCLAGFGSNWHQIGSFFPSFPPFGGQLWTFLILCQLRGILAATSAGVRRCCLQLPVTFNSQVCHCFYRQIITYSQPSHLSDNLFQKRQIRGSGLSSTPWNISWMTEWSLDLYW